MAIDKKAYAEYIATQSAWQGRRVRDLRKGDDTDTHDKIGCAITASVLQELKYLAAAKPLNQHDVQAFLDGFLEAASMTWETLTMGGQQIVRIADQKETPK